MNTGGNVHNLFVCAPIIFWDHFGSNFGTILGPPGASWTPFGFGGHSGPPRGRFGVDFGTRPGPRFGTQNHRKLDAFLVASAERFSRPSGLLAVVVRGPFFDTFFLNIDRKVKVILSR